MSKYKYYYDQPPYCTQNEIYIQLNKEEYVQVPFICYNHQGEFLLAPISDEKFFSWDCPKCGFSNPFWARSC